VETSNQQKEEGGGWAYTIVFKSGATVETYDGGLKTAFHDWQNKRASAGFANELGNL